MKWKSFAASLLCALLLSGGASAVDVMVDGEPLDGEAVLEGDSTYVPLAPLLEALGGWETSWDENTRSARADTGIFALTASIGENVALADGYAYALSGDIVIRDDRTYVPLRSVANLLGAQVQFLDWSVPVEVSSGRAAVPYSDEDLYWLSRAISAESRGEPLVGQIAVGNVVLNRVESEKFPDTIKEVLFDTKDAVQFEPVSNGTIYDEPTEQSVLAAKLALNGTDVVGECMYFFAPALSQGLWIRENCNYFTTIGCHRFYTD